DAVSDWLATAQAEQGSGSGHAEQEDTFLQTNSGETRDSYLLLRDVEGRPLAVLANSVSHAALQLGARAISGGLVARVLRLSLLTVLLLNMVNHRWRIRAVVQRQSIDQQRKFSRLARRDPLTGLPNRFYLQKLLPRLIKRAARDESRMALLHIDLDHFKNVND